MRSRGVSSYIGLLGGLALGLGISLYWPAEGARNAAGTYSLPAGSPVQAGQTITASNENTFRSDVASELTNSLDRSGRGAMTGQLKLSAGTSSLPGLAWSAETNTGFYRASAADIREVVTATTVAKSLVTGKVYPLITTHQAGLTCTQSGSGSCGTFTGGSSSGAGGTFTGGTTNGSGVVANGTGTGAGIAPTGGATSGAGVDALGGAPNGNGVVGQGDGTGKGVWGRSGDTNGSIGVYGDCGATNCNGVEGLGAGTGIGVLGTPGAGATYGVKGVSANTSNTACVAGVSAHTGVPAILGDATGAAAYAVVASGDTTSPVRAGLRVVPQDTAPSTAAHGDIYANVSGGTLNFHDGTRWNQVAKTLTGSVTHNFGNTTAGTCATEQSITVTGAADGDACAVGSANAVDNGVGGIFFCRVSAANTVQLKFCCNNTSDCDPNNGAFKVVVFKD